MPIIWGLTDRGTSKAEAAIKMVGKKDPHTLCSMEDVNDDGFTDLVCHYLLTGNQALPR